MFADAERINADLVGEDTFVDNVADDLGVGEELAVGVGGDIAESIQSEFKSLSHTFQFTLLWAPLSARRGVGNGGEVGQASCLRNDAPRATSPDFRRIGT